MNKTYVTIEQEYFEILLSAYRELEKMKDSTREYVYLYDHLSHVSPYTGMGKITAINKFEALALMKDQIDRSDNKATSLWAKLNALRDTKLPMFNFMKSGDRQAFDQAKENFVTAVLRQESGANIPDSEFDREDTKYFPQPGDKEDVLTQKKQNRQTVIEGFTREAGAAYKPNQLITPSGIGYKVVE